MTRRYMMEAVLIRYGGQDRRTISEQDDLTVVLLVQRLKLCVVIPDNEQNPEPLDDMSMPR